MTKVRDVIEVMHRAYPESAAAEWDTGIGLTCGNPDSEIAAVLLAVDADPNTVVEAITMGAGMLLTHHPLLFRAVQSIAADTAKGSLLHRLIRADVAHFAAHTNADVAVHGVNDALADTLGLANTRALVPLVDDPTVGNGRIGELPEALTLRAFVHHVGGRLPPTVAGIRASGGPGRLVRTVALCGGAGDSLLPAAAGAGADVYVTSDLRHHVVAEFTNWPGNPAVVDVAHWAGEWPWLARAAVLLEAELPDLRVEISTINTDPWTVHVGTLADS